MGWCPGIYIGMCGYLHSTTYLRGTTWTLCLRVKVIKRPRSINFWQNKIQGFLLDLRNQ